MKPKYDGENLKLCYMDTDSLVYEIKTENFYSSSIRVEDTGPFSIFMATLTLQNAYLWLRWPSLMRGYQDTFSPHGGTHDEAPKCMNVALLALYNAYLWLCFKLHIFQYHGAIC